MASVHVASAQIVNVESGRPVQDSAGWTGTVDAGFDVSQTTVQLFQLHGGSQLQYAKVKSTFLSLNSYKLVFSENEQFENTAHQHFRYGYDISKLLRAEAFTQLQSDEVLRIQLRWLIGAGPRFRIVEKKKVESYAGLIYMYEYEEEKGNDIYHRDHRLSANWSIKAQLGKTLSIYHITYYQPRLDFVADYRVSSGTTLSFKITELLAYQFRVGINYDAYPVVDPDIPSFTYTIRNGLAFQF